MSLLLDQGVDLILWMQRASPRADTFFIGVTMLGGQEFFLAVLPLIYWCVDRRTGVRLSILFLLSGYTNALAKSLIGQPRPFAYVKCPRARNEDACHNDKNLRT